MLAVAGLYTHFPAAQLSELEELPAASSQRELSAQEAAQAVFRWKQFMTVVRVFVEVHTG